MRKTKLWVAIISSLVVLFTHYSCKTSQSHSDLLMDYNLAEKMTDPATMAMSDIFSELTYLPLEMVEGAHLDLIETIIPTTDGYLIQTYASKLKLFDLQGKYLRDIGRIGKGPGEYVSVENVYWDDKANELIVYNLQVGNLIFYSIEGEFLRSIELPYPAQFLHRLYNGSFLGITYLPVKMGAEFGKHFIFTRDGETKTFWTTADQDGIKIPRLTIVPEFCRVNDKDLFLPVQSDTIFLIENNSLVPMAILGLSDLLIPDNVYYNQEPSADSWDKYISNIDLKSFGTDGFMVMFDLNKKSYSTFCSINKPEVKLLSKSESENSWMANDIDGGLPIIGFSHLSCYGNLMIQAVNSVNLVSLLENNMFPGLSDEFKNLIKDLDEDGNPVLFLHRTIK